MSKTKRQPKRVKGWVWAWHDGHGRFFDRDKPRVRPPDRAARLVEHLPGDVVLSREDAEELRNIVRSPMLLTGNRNRALALLRGRR